MVDSVIPNALPHLELTPPPSSASVGGFLGDALGNFIDLVAMSRFNAMPAFMGSFKPMMQVGETMGLNSFLTPVSVKPGESIWGQKLYSTASGFAEGAIVRGVGGKVFSKGTPDLTYYGAAGFNSAINDAFTPNSYSVFKQFQANPTDKK